MRAAALLVVLLVACKGKNEDDTAVALAEGPALSHEAPADVLIEGGSVTLSVGAEDPDGVSTVTVYHRTQGESFWDSTSLERGDGDLWTGLVDDLKAPGLEYYIKGVDGAATRGTSYLPEDGTTAPLVLAVRPLTQAVPWTEDFETDGDVDSLFALGWTAPSLDFNAYPWQITNAYAASGALAAYHPRGYQDIGGLDDWLVSPPLDLSTVDTAMVRWVERGASVAAMEGHALYLSTSSRDPADGTFVAVEEALPAPTDGVWGRSLAYDLSAYAGEPVVYLAWRYTGTDTSDDWYIDDVAVTELLPDLSATLSWSPDPVHPGEDAALHVDIDNATAALVSGLSATLSLPDGGGTLAAETVSVGDIAGNGSGAADFTLSLDPALHDNRYLDLSLDLSDGAQSWTFPLQMTVGLPSTGTVDLSLIEDATLNIILGVGDPAAPLFTVPVVAGSYLAGDYSLSVDLTPYYAYLPATAGPQRWFAQVQADGQGYTTAFSIEESGLVATNPAVEVFFDSYDATVYLPEPPSPTLVSASTSPSSLRPGDSAALSLVLRNDGADSAGPVNATLTTDDPDVTITSAGPLALTSGTWGRGVATGLSGLAFAISPTHTDSTPVSLALSLDDGVDAWSLPLSVAVPWPYLRVTRVTIDDDGRDGILDAGESAELEIELANAGDRSTYGLVSAVLSAEASGTAPVTLTATTGSYGLLSVGAVKDENGFELTVDPAALPGQTVDLLLTLSDGTATYEARTSLVIGEPPWSLLSPSDDPLGDALDAYDMDFVNGSARVVGTKVEVLLESAVPLDPSTLFIESWGVASSATYTYYRWVLQSGVTTMQGYSSTSGFSTIGTMDVEFPSANTVLLRWDTEDMGLISRSFSLGFAAGWCGPPTYYCEHFPDGWGYPYDAFSTGDWFNIRW